MAWHVEWFVFISIACVSSVGAYLLNMRSQEKAGLYFLSALFWLASTFQWGVDQIGNDNFMLIAIHLVPLILTVLYGVSSAIENMDGEGKVNPFG